jgi:hypothetical protein
MANPAPDHAENLERGDNVSDRNTCGTQFTLSTSFKRDMAFGKSQRLCAFLHPFQLHRLLRDSPRPPLLYSLHHFGSKRSMEATGAETQGLIDQ